MRLLPMEWSVLRTQAVWVLQRSVLMVRQPFAALASTIDV